MRFRDQVVAFDFAGIPMVGNMNTGYAIGLTAEGADVCERLLREEVAETEVAAVDAALLEHLVRGGFFSDEKPADAVVLVYDEIAGSQIGERIEFFAVRGFLRRTDALTLLPDGDLSLC